MNSNTRHLLIGWGFAISLGVLVAFVLGSALWQGQVWQVLLPIAATAILLTVIRWRVGDRQVRRLLQSDSPEALVTFYQRSIRPGLMPQGDALLAQVCAVAYTLYGDFSAAWEALQGIDWDQRPPLIAASGRSVEALLCYFQTGEYEQGLELARSAQEIARVSGWFPGAQKSADSFESFVEIGEVLCGHSTDSTVRSLERKMRVLPTLGRLIVAWGLGIAYRRAGDARANAMCAHIQEVAPYCRALELPPAAR
jgi:hypothetical protein